MWSSEPRFWMAIVATGGPQSRFGRLWSFPVARPFQNRSFYGIRHRSQLHLLSFRYINRMEVVPVKLPRRDRILAYTQRSLTPPAVLASRPPTAVRPSCYELTSVEVTAAASHLTFLTAGRYQNGLPKSR